MACSPVSVISLIMDRALHLVIAKVRVRYPLKPGFFQVLFQPLRLFIQLQDHVHFEVHCLHESFFISDRSYTFIDRLRCSTAWSPHASFTPSLFTNQF